MGGTKKKFDYPQQSNSFCKSNNFLAIAENLKNLLALGSYYWLELYLSVIENPQGYIAS